MKESFSEQLEPRSGDVQVKVKPSATPADEKPILEQLLELSRKQLQVMEGMKRGIDGISSKLDGLQGGT